MTAYLNIILICTNGCFQHLTYTDPTYQNSIEYFISGAANFIDTSVEHKNSVPAGSSKFHWADELSFGGFAVVNTTPNKMTFTFVEASGKQLYEKVMYPRKV